MGSTFYSSLRSLAFFPFAPSACLEVVAFIFLCLVLQNRKEIETNYKKKGKKRKVRRKLNTVMEVSKHACK